MGNNGGCDPFYMGWEKFLEEMKCLEVRNSNTLQCSCLENLRDGVAQSPTRLKWLRSERYFTLEELFSSECASQSPRGLVKMDRWALQGVWFHRLEWGPIICFFFFFLYVYSPDAFSDHTLGPTALGYPESIHSQGCSAWSWPFIVLRYILQWLLFTYRASKSSRPGYCQPL